MVPDVLRFDESGATDRDRVGGKAANLGRLTGAGFPVPPGFVVTTGAYRAFVEVDGLEARIARLLAGIDHEDPADVEAGAASIRRLFTERAVPERIRHDVLAAYRALGADRYVAVRSSGTAEDLAEASFAGQHDTYLDVRGEDDLLAAVVRCWASLWTARAVAYRRRSGFERAEVALAVVVQTMVEAEVSGVLFTANPMTTRTDEVVVDASWGLGEAIVSGIVTPDQFRVAHHGFSISAERIADKAVRVVRDPVTGRGTVTEEVPPPLCDARTLTDRQLGDLAGLGLRVQRFYDDLPQDIEWALAGGEFFLLQSRDVTGVEFSWDEELEVPVELQPEPAPDTVWTRAWADSVWPGAVTPLFYSIRQQMGVRMHAAAESLWGMDEVARLRPSKYHRGRVYYNTLIDAANTMALVPPALRRPELLAMVPPTRHAEVLGADYDWLALPKLLARIRLLDPVHGPWRCWAHLDREMADRAKGLGRPVAEIRALSDQALLDYLHQRILAQKEWVEDLWTPFFLFMPMFMAALIKMLEDWYRGDNPAILTDLITGLPAHTITLTENLELWTLSELIRGSDTLRAQFTERPGREFFDRLEETDEGQAFKAAHDRFLVEFGCRGHADRDLYATRREEDPALDHASLRALLTAESVAPDETLAALVARRRAAEDDLIAHARRQPLGALKVEAFRWVHSWLLKFFTMRDNERHHTDRITMSKKYAVNEIAHRLRERGVLDGDDHYFLSVYDVTDLLRGRPLSRLMQARIAGRRRNWERVAAGSPSPMYLRDGLPMDLETPADASDTADGVLRGLGTSRGEVTGTARIIPSHRDIGRVRKGDVLITSATDPGWTSVFLVVSGLVLETGGMLAHGSCISREYGIPAVQVPGAMRHIPDGATITVNGDLGTVTIHDHGGSA